MSDRPQDTNDAPLPQWQAADGSWHPHPPGLDGRVNSVAPTPPPSHPPYSLRPEPRAETIWSTPSAETVRPRRRSIVALSGLCFLLGAIAIFFAFIAFTREDRDLRSADEQFDVVIQNVIDAENINKTFLDTFYSSIAIFLAQVEDQPAEQRLALGEQWFDEMSAQLDQFQNDLYLIDAAFTALALDENDPADTVRDNAVSHYRSWKEWVGAVPNDVREWLDGNEFKSSQRPSVIDDLDQAEESINAEITRTFENLCDSLSQFQPLDGSYEVTVFEICQP